MLRSLFLFLLFSVVSTVAFSQASLSGKVTDEETSEPMISATVVLFKNDVQITGTITDLDGNYSFSNLDPGTYDVQITYTGYTDVKTTGVQVLAGKAIKLDVEITEGALIDIGIVVKGYRVPLIQQDNTTSGGVITSDQIKNLPSRSISALAATTAGVSSADEGDALSIRGSRSNGTDYYIDGVRVTGALIPETEIEQLQVITGGMEAKYGDAIGGIISIVTKGPSNKFSGNAEVETSEFLDDFNRNLVGLSLTGPILKNKKGISILGYRFAGRYSSSGDDDPPAVPIYRIKDSKLAELEANPTFIPDGGNQPRVASEQLGPDDVDVLGYRPFEGSNRIDVTAKLDARLSDAIDLSFTGAYVNTYNRFTPGGWRTLNSHNNPVSEFESYRGNFRFRHRIGGAGGSESSSSTIQNASYVLQFGYETTSSKSYDFNHEDNIFEYGYIGKFDVDWVPVFSRNDTTGLLEHQDYLRVLRGYDPSPVNQVLANYNLPFGFGPEEGINGQVVDVLTPDNFAAPSWALDNFSVINGRLDGRLTSAWNHHSHVGQVYNTNSRSANDLYTFNGNVAFDFLPGGSEKGRHNIELGIYYEQRTNRSYTVAPFGLWVLARQRANEHLEQGLTSDVIGTIMVPGTGEEAALKDYFTPTSIDETNLFYRKLREAIDVPIDQWVNVDGLDPSQLDLSMFSARALNDRGFLGYLGYDYLGNEFNGTFDDFFNTIDPATGFRSFPVAPNRPIYGAAYLQDKFTFKDIIFRVGLRVDRYDANTRVLKDIYSLYELMGADDFHQSFGGNRPGNIGDDYKVYVAGQQSSEVTAYRDGDQWYKADGTPVNNPTDIDGVNSGLVFGFVKDERARDDVNFIKKEEFDTGISFEDYETQINFMPRLAFSFPISEDANFFAHYDILVQRPSSNTIATALSYYNFIDNAGAIKNNPNLRPEKTIDYEVGFQQKLSESSAITINAYYKELRDMIQERVIFPVPDIGQYTTFDNIDFGTVKGFSLKYDLRRTGNISMQANYTLQFADGTGSNANSSRGLNNRGVIRTLFPFDYDERHRFVINLDYRYASGALYNGPRIGGLDILSNFGVNLQTTAVSGRPFTINNVPQEFGGTGLASTINGARKPWTYRLDLRVDKTIRLKKNFAFNVYLRVTNLLDRRNIIAVYPFTGQPDDDGFLQSSFGDDQLGQLTEQEEIYYLASYSWRILNPNYYSLPRRFFLGASFNF